MADEDDDKWKTNVINDGKVKKGKKKKKKKQKEGEEWEKVEMQPPPTTSNQKKSGTAPSGGTKKSNKKNNKKTVKKSNSSSPSEPKKRIIRVGHKTMEIEDPPKTLLLIWILMAAKLVLDLVTSAIAFTAFLEEPGLCCDTPINTGLGPLAVVIPFFILVLLELVFLLRSVVLTLFPWMMVSDVEDQKKCSLTNWNAKFCVWMVNILTIINPYFGLGISWMLMYQSDKVEALTVMGLELATIILHFISVKLENAASNWLLKLMHASIVLPWLAGMSINVWYINRGGVCYDSALETFWWKGCEICPSGLQPVNDTLCPTTTLVNGTNVTTYEDIAIWDLGSATNCAADPQVCWFEY
ncbi:unnamed protein product [Cylindrotheca closterium]|uniref:Transmembrane protein n=1 Tax=Cylindrotheca closterium TaxID=2856 RepID=A0AAD2CT99_9STRA|nr:unnamed protein product [Cylindrotheca closterium]